MSTIWVRLQKTVCTTTLGQPGWTRKSACTLWWLLIIISPFALSSLQNEFGLPGILPAWSRMIVRLLLFLAAFDLFLAMPCSKIQANLLGEYKGITTDRNHDQTFENIKVVISQNYPQKHSLLIRFLWSLISGCITLQRTFRQFKKKLPK